MRYRSETPFDNIESALEYVNDLLEATREARDQIEMEILRATNPQLAQRKQALQLVNYKLDKLSSHIATSRRILNDLRTLRRLLLEFIPRGVGHPYGEPVTSFGDQKHKRLDVPGCGCIQWIHTDCDVHRLERRHG